MRIAGPTLFALPAIVVLILLGSWQWQRKTWKEGLLQQLQAAQESEPSTLSSLLAFKEPDAIRFRRMRLAGSFLHDHEIHMWLPGEKGSAWRIITPLKLDAFTRKSAGMPSHVLVIRGVVDDAHKSRATRPEERQSESQVSLTARVRFDSSNWATPEPNREKNRWYALDNGKMAAALTAHLPSAQVAPFFAESEVVTAPLPGPQPNLQQLTLRNRHLEYALTWWGLALTLLGVYAAFVCSRLRQPER